jgi:dihydropyrimidinase
MVMKILIQGGTIVTAEKAFSGDVLVIGERIAAVGNCPNIDVDRVIDATDRLVIPGGIDAHTHLDMPLGDIKSADDFETGTIAAAFGGTTCIIDFATPEPGESLQQALDTWMEKAHGKAVIDYGFHMVLREYGLGIEKEMARMVDAGVTSFKLFMAYTRTLYLDDGLIFRAMQRAGELGALTSVHAENGQVIDELVLQALEAGQTAPRYHALTRPPQTEAEATHRAIALAEMADAPIYIVHLSSTEALDEIKIARASGLPVHAETCPQYLFLSDECYERPGLEAAKYVMSPPLRSKEGQEELWRGLAYGDIEVVGTDHCPFPLHEKERGKDDFTKIPNGAPGIENRVSLIYHGGVVGGHFDVKRWVEVTATAPARIFGLFPRKGTIQPGSDADIVVFNPDVEVEIRAASHHMNVDYNAYEGFKVKGVAEIVLTRGQIIVENGSFLGKPGGGEYLRRSPSW